ncbi:MAG: universal stress protein [Rhodocyclales bacterium]|nr:universal stress protein [Rhodocyclales bacterium]
MYKKIMVAIDDSDTSHGALAEALHIARSSQAKLYIVHVADETLLGMQHRTLSTTLNVEQAFQTITQAGSKLLADALAQAQGLEAEVALLEARQQRVSEVLLAKAKELGVDLIVVGRHGQRGLAKLILGSVAEQLAKLADASVLLVRKH